MRNNTYGVWLNGNWLVVKEGTRSRTMKLSSPMIRWLRGIAINLFGNRCFRAEAGSFLSARCQNTRATRSRATPDVRALFYTLITPPYSTFIYTSARDSQITPLLSTLYLTLVLLRVIIERVACHFGYISSRMID